MFIELSGARPIKTAGGALCIILINDEYLRYRWTYILANKSEANAGFCCFLADIRNQGVPRTVDCACSDNGADFVGEASKDHCNERGIRQEFKAGDTPKLDICAGRLS